MPRELVAGAGIRRCFGLSDDPGFECDLLVTADTVALHRVWIGRLAMIDALREDLIQVGGPRELVRAFPQWLALSSFAGIEAASSGVRT